MRRLAAGRNTTRSRVMMLALILTAGGLATACGGSEPAEVPQQAAPVVNPVDPATAGRITGRVAFTGRAPEPQPVRTASDPRCTAPVRTEEVVLGEDGTLQNVFVYVKDGLGDLVFPVPAEPVVLGQEGCMYRPRVLGIQVGQTLEILNGDATLHNIHAMPEHNAEFNKAQTGEGARNTHVFSTEEIMVPFKCDVHRWMNAYVGVVRHPFHAVTGAEGAFSLDGLPPGTYTIEAVHETLGRQTQTVTLEERGTAELSFTFAG